MLASQQIAEVVADRVRAVAAFASSTFTDRDWAFEEDELPAARVYVDDEDITATGVSRPVSCLHDADIVVALECKSTDTIRATLAGHIADVLTAMHADAAHTALLAVKCQTFFTTRITREPNPEGQANVGRAVITNRARFLTRANAPEAII
jgi:hypothetical protein